MMDNYSSYLEYVNNCDRDDPLLSSTGLGQQLSKIHLDTMDSKDLNPLNEALNLEQILTTNEGLARDYRGIAELMGFSTIEIETHFKKSSNPMKSIIEAFVNKKSSSLNELIKMIERIERFDIIDDFMPTLVQLATEIDQKQANIVGDIDRLTLNGEGISPETEYDAFVCYAPEDAHYTYWLISQLKNYDKKIATANDLQPGSFQHDSLVHLIDQQCHKVIIILTPDFLRSKECEFQTKFANEVALKAGCPKVIPVLFKACDEKELPVFIRQVSKIDMTSQQNISWQMDKLRKSLSST